MQLDESTFRSTIKSVVNEVIDEHPTIQRMGSEIGELKTDVAEIKKQGKVTTHSINQIQMEQQRQGVMMEQMWAEVCKVLEIALPSKRREGKGVSHRP